MSAQGLAFELVAPDRRWRGPVGHLGRLDAARQVALELADADPARFGLLTAALKLPLNPERAIDALAEHLREAMHADELRALLARSAPARRPRGRRERGSL